jgi:hypothetical protein
MFRWEWESVEQREHRTVDEKEGDSGNKYNFSRTNFSACSGKMHYTREGNDFGYFSDVWRNKCDMFQIALFVKLWNLISYVCERGINVENTPERSSEEKHKMERSFVTRGLKIYTLYGYYVGILKEEKRGRRGLARMASGRLKDCEIFGRKAQ